MSRQSDITKSLYLSGLQCPKLAWTRRNAPGTVPGPTPGQQHMFATGDEIGLLARRLHPKGYEIEAEPGHHLEAARETAAMMNLPAAERVPLFEATFMVAGRLCRVDILVPGPGGTWDIVEVKSSTRVRDVTIHDVAFQADTLAEAGARLGRQFVLHVNTGYVRGDRFEVESFFELEDVTERVTRVREYVPAAVERVARATAGPDPDTPIGPRCHTPHACPLVPHCWADLPPGNVTELYRGGAEAFALLDEGLFTIADLPEDMLTAKQRIQRSVLRAGEPHVDVPALQVWLDALDYPLHHLDFETMNPAIPRLAGMRPYQQVPFQFSLHVQDTPGATPRHVEFLADGAGDPRPGLVAALHAIGETGSIMVWNMGFEKGVLEDLAEVFPAEAEWLSGLADRLVDLIVPFRRFWYHDAAQKGRCSLKAVLPALTGRDYGDLAITDGNQAARAYVEAVYGESDAPSRDRVLADLRAYCRLDTLAMVQILAVLQGAVAE